MHPTIPFIGNFDMVMMSTDQIIHKCIEHQYMKKGKCPCCGICKYCLPSESCSTKTNHKPWTKQAKNKAKLNSQGRTSLDHSVIDDVIQHKAKSHKDSDALPDMFTSSRKQVLTNIFLELGCPTNLMDEFPKNGFSLDTIDVSKNKVSIRQSN